MREPQDDEQRKRQELRAGEDVDRPGGAAHPDHVHDCHGAGEGRHHDRARSAARDLGPELGEVEHEKVQVRGGTQEARPHEQPADLESDQRAEGDARIKINAAMFAEPARDLREAERDEPDATCGSERRQRAQAARRGGEDGGQAEDAAADHPVDDGRREIETADRADETGIAQPLPGSSKPSARPDSHIYQDTSAFRAAAKLLHRGFDPALNLGVELARLAPGGLDRPDRSRRGSGPVS